MDESNIVNAIVKVLRSRGYRVATEVANFNRSADIAAIDPDGNVWVIECKVSNIKKAVEQLRTHKLSADRVCIGTFYRNTKKITLETIRKAGVGLIYVMPDGTIVKEIEEGSDNDPWRPAKNRLQRRVMDMT